MSLDIDLKKTCVYYLSLILCYLLNERFRTLRKHILCNKKQINKQIDD